MKSDRPIRSQWIKEKRPFKVLANAWKETLRGDRAWIKISSLIKNKRIAIPLNTTVEPNGTLRLILHDGIVEVYYTLDI